MVWHFELRIEQTITCSYLIGDSSEDKKPNGPKKCVIKRKLKFEKLIYFVLKNIIKNKKKTIN